MKVKRFLNSILQEELEPIRTRREELARDMDSVTELLRVSSLKAREVAGKTLSEVRHAMKIDYFG